MKIQDLSNKEKVAVVIVGYNRLSSLQRLLRTINQANYQVDDIPLIICLDCSNDQQIYNMVDSFEWKHGDKFVIIQPKRLGLKDHILFCGDLTQYFKAIILLEDDIIPAPHFYSYVCQALKFYYPEDRIAGIALYRNQYNGYVGLPNFSYHNGYDVFLSQSVCSWGQCWTDKMWNSFKSWYIENEQIDFSTIDMPVQIGQWTHAWSKFMYAYIIQTNRFFLFPYESMSTNYHESGEHCDYQINSLQVEMEYGNRKYLFGAYEELVKYDVYGYNLDIKSYIPIIKDLTVDFWGYKPLKFRKKYLLSCKVLDFRIVRTFGMILKPIELNVFHQVGGTGIFLYDTSVPQKNNKKEGIFDYFFSYIPEEYIFERFMQGRRRITKALINYIIRHI